MYSEYHVFFNEHMASPVIDCPKPMVLHQSASIQLRFQVKRLTLSTTPPSYQNVDLLTYAPGKVRLIIKQHVRDDDAAALFDEEGSIETPGIDPTDFGWFKFAWPVDFMDFSVDQGYAEIVLSESGDGSDPEWRIGFPITVLPRGRAPG